MILKRYRLLTTYCFSSNVFSKNKIVNLELIQTKLNSFKKNNTHLKNLDEIHLDLEKYCSNLENLNNLSNNENFKKILEDIMEINSKHFKKNHLTIHLKLYILISMLKLENLFDIKKFIGNQHLFKIYFPFISKYNNTLNCFQQSKNLENFSFFLNISKKYSQLKISDNIFNQKFEQNVTEIFLKHQNFIKNSELIYLCKFFIKLKNQSQLIQILNNQLIKRYINMFIFFIFILKKRPF